MLGFSYDMMSLERMASRASIEKTTRTGRVSVSIVLPKLSFIANADI